MNININKKEKNLIMNKMEVGNWVKVSEKIELEENELSKLQKNYNMIKSKELMNSLKVFVKSLGTNIKYNLEDINSSSLNQLIKNNNIDFILFGKIINEKNIKFEGKKILDSLAWFSYRKNFPYIFSDNGIFFTTDANWGCTIRVCQMMLFNIFYDHLIKKYNLENIDNKKKKELRDCIISNFLDCPFNIFSIYNFCRIGKMRKNAKVGEFWKPNITVSNMMYLLQEQKKISINLKNQKNDKKIKKKVKTFKTGLINKNERINVEIKEKEKNHKKIYKEKKEIKKNEGNISKIELNTNDIVIYLSADGVIFCKEIAKKIYNPKIPSICNCKKKTNYKFFLNFGIKIPNLCPKCDFSKNLIIFCFLRTGLYKSEKENLNYLNELVKYNKFSGGVIGKGNSAYYLIGTTGKDYIYLDPHFVQKTKFDNNEDLFKSYNVLSLRSIREDKLNVCVGISFKICSFQEYKELIGFFDELKEKYKDSFYLSFVKNEDEDY